MPEIVEQDGASAGVWWFVRNMPRYEQTRRAFGPVATHVLCVTISVLNGCRYCTYGHAYALELCYLDDRGALFPLDEHQIVALGSCSEDQASDRIEGALRTAGLPREVDLVRRMLALRAGTVHASGAEDRRLVHLLEMFRALNTCGIRGNVSPDQAHDPINKDRVLRERYARLRGA
jgi:hypothetical protein